MAELRRPSAVTVRVLTLNVFIRPPGINNNGEDFKDERLQELLPRVADFDVVCFQELFGRFSKRQSSLLKEARKFGFHYYVSLPAPSLWSTMMGAIKQWGLVVTDGGVTIISKYPIIAQDTIVYDMGVNADMLAAKGAVYAKLQTPDGKAFHLFTSHLQASYRANDAKGAQLEKAEEKQGGMGKKKRQGKKPIVNNCPEDDAHHMGNLANERVRWAQVGALSDFMQLKLAADEPDIPVILAGDLNINSRTSPENGTDHSAPYLRLVRDELSQPDYIVRDILYETYGEHPATVGDYSVDKQGNKVFLETQLTNPLDYGCSESIDYILLFQHHQHCSPEDKERAIVTSDSDRTTTPGGISNVRVMRAGVEKFLVEGKKYTQLSDHYGASIEFEIP